MTHWSMKSSECASFSVVPTHNKQLERTVIPHRGDAASAPFHYALASRFTRQRAAAQLRRYIQLKTAAD
jgi:hypothetical protein